MILTLCLTTALGCSIAVTGTPTDPSTKSPCPVPSRPPPPAHPSLQLLLGPAPLHPAGGAGARGQAMHLRGAGAVQPHAGWGGRQAGGGRGKAWRNDARTALGTRHMHQPSSDLQAPLPHRPGHCPSQTVELPLSLAHCQQLKPLVPPAHTRPPHLLSLCPAPLGPPPPFGPAPSRRRRGAHQRRAGAAGGAPVLGHPLTACHLMHSNVGRSVQHKILQPCAHDAFSLAA